MKEDSYIDIARVLLTRPRAMRPYQRIFLLSHMRANTSLMGHILGDSPDINGYYELHIGYYSWRSLLRQKYRFFSEHQPKPGGRYMFDKVLHNDHEVDLSLFKHAKLIFSIRPPEKTIPSIVRLYSGRPGPKDECASIEGASAYYLRRLDGLVKLSQETPCAYCFMDADALRSSPSVTLEQLSDFLELSAPLKEEYTKQPMTGAHRAGDSSAEIHSGKIQTNTSSNNPPLDHADLAPLQAAYMDARTKILGHMNCALKITDGEVS